MRQSIWLVVMSKSIDADGSVGAMDAAYVVKNSRD